MFCSQTVQSSPTVFFRSYFEVEIETGKARRDYREEESKAPVSQLVNTDDTSVIEIKTQHYLES